MSGISRIVSRFGAAALVEESEPMLEQASINRQTRKRPKIRDITAFWRPFYHNASVPAGASMRRAVLMALTLAAIAASISAQTVRSPNLTLTAIRGIKVGHYTLTERPTGCTVVLVESGAVAGVDVRGAAPATSETDLLNPAKMVQEIYGIALSGGSTFGLDSRSGVVRYLEEHKIGIAFGGLRVPIVPAASIFDLGVGNASIRPSVDCGYRAAQAATTAPVPEGSVGAGAGATIGKLAGMTRAMMSGVGSAAITLPDGSIVAALAVVNALGDVIDPATGKVVAGVRTPDGKGLADARMLIRSGAARGGANSTIGVVATNARLTKAQATHLAQMADDGYARAIWPIHTIADGDTVFAISTGERTGNADLIALGALAADAMSAAVVRAATQAVGRPGLPAARDLK
jgi:L-aminopeptidase/D-esterase-like protein